jgi:hypothetical protein
LYVVVPILGLNDEDRSMSNRRGRSSALAIPLVFACALGSGCGDRTTGSQAATSALVVGAASGPIFDELASAYRVSFGDGTEPPQDYAVVIYDGNSLTPEEIQSLPSTDGFLRAGKILIVLHPGVDDLQALQGELGAVPLSDTPAAAVFKTYSSEGLLQAANMVEFPTTVTEDPTPPDGAAGGADPGVLAGATATQVAVDDATLRAEAHEWRAIFESEYLAATRGASASALAAAGPDGAAASSGALPEATPSGPPEWLLAPHSVPPANGSPFWTVRQFIDTKPVMLQMTSALYDPANQGVRSDSTSALQRGLCFFIPRSSSFDLKPAAPSTATVLITHAVNRLLQENAGTYNHNIIVRQYVRSSPTVLRPTEPLGTETVDLCRALASRPFPPLGWYCAGSAFGCNDFKEGFPVQSLLGFNAQVQSSLGWDPRSAPLLSVSSVRPVAANNVSTVKTAEDWSLNVNWSIQGALELETLPPNVGLRGPGVGGSVNWGWSTTENMSIQDWETRPNSSGSTAVHDLFAASGGNSTPNLAKFATTTGNGVLSFQTLNGLQESFLESRTETSWVTTGALLPPGNATLTSRVTLSYGEVYDRFSAVKEIDPAPLPYGALHSFTVSLPIELDFANPILQPPVPATWSVSADLSRRANRDGFFPVQGTVTLDEEAAADTTLDLGAEIYNFGNAQPAPSVVKSLPTKVTIHAGESSASFDFLVQRIGSPYNIRLWAFRATGQQVAYPMTVPAS